MKVFITGTAGFIGFHLAKTLLEDGSAVSGFDSMNTYYDVTLKKARNDILKKYDGYEFLTADLKEYEKLKKQIIEFEPDVIVHLAAQAGVRYSLDNPRAYIDSNIIGTFNIIEIAKEFNIEHLLFASTSSIYGGNTEMPFKETHKADLQLTIYSATKKASESMCHSYSHLWGIPITVVRFFTVYGPWGRPDLALFKFVSAILDGRKIDIYNNGDMYRDFTYVGDLVHAIKLLLSVIPPLKSARSEVVAGDTISPVAPYRVVNIGNGAMVKLSDFVECIENKLGIEAKRNYMEMQMGDVTSTHAETSLLEKLTGYRPNTDIKDGVASFIDWYKEYYR